MEADRGRNRKKDRQGERPRQRESKRKRKQERERELRYKSCKIEKQRWEYTKVNVERSKPSRD